ncbi:unnamed protein product [Pedinophyceae sp. YPF-701]|nr:unnamed protein product [Pedinophyceae sp. YPF-701]
MPGAHSPKPKLQIVAVVIASLFLALLLVPHISQSYRSSAMADFRALTVKYVAAFNGKDLQGCMDLFEPALELTDPSGTYKGVDAVQGLVSSLFDSAGDNFAFKARNVYVDDKTKTSLIEFTLKLGDKDLQGVDVIEWSDAGKMTTLRAYVY